MASSGREDDFPRLFPRVFCCDRIKGDKLIMKKTTLLIIVSRLWRVSLGLILLTSLVLVGAVCEEESRKEKDEEEEYKLTLEVLKNAEYYCEACMGWVKLQDGSYSEEKEESGMIFIRETWMAEDIVVYGDLNSDGKEDVVVIIVSNFGGSGVFVELVVMINDKGNPLYLDSEILGDRIIINSIAIEFSEIILDMVIQGPDDALCCPTLEKVVRYKISGNKLVEIK